MAKSDKTNIKKTDLLNASDFGKLIGCSHQMILKMLEEGKMTEGLSYLRDGRKIYIDVEKARAELRTTTKRNTCRNNALLDFLGLPDLAAAEIESKTADLVNNMDIYQVRMEMERSELRLSLMEEYILDGKYIERAPAERAMEAAGIEVRNAFNQLATKVIPHILAAQNPREAENILHKAIEDVLIKVSNITTKGLVDEPGE